MNINPINIFLIFFTYIFLFDLDSYAQKSDSLQLVKKDESIMFEKGINHDPHKATLYAAILPGMGQVYNKQTWKVPVLYAGIGTLGYFIYWNNNRHLDFKDSFLAKRENRPDDDPFPFLSEERVQVNKDFFRRNRDLLVIISVLVYGLNIVDATVFAHLRSFDVDDNLSFRIEPNLSSTPQELTAGVSLKINFNAVKK